MQNEQPSLIWTVLNLFSIFEPTNLLALACAVSQILQSLEGIRQEEYMMYLIRVLIFFV